jgi:hypothetical protein
VIRRAIVEELANELRIWSVIIATLTAPTPVQSNKTTVAHITFDSLAPLGGFLFAIGFLAYLSDLSLAPSFQILEDVVHDLGSSVPSRTDDAHA